VVIVVMVIVMIILVKMAGILMATYIQLFSVFDGV
jgi:hypothetical protein